MDFTNAVSSDVQSSFPSFCSIPYTQPSLIVLCVNYQKVQLTFGNFNRPGSVGGVQIDLLDELNIGQERDEGHEVGEADGLGAAAGLGRGDQVHFHLKSDTKCPIY